MHDVGVTLDDHLLREPDGTCLGNATDIVAAQIDQHQVLCDLLLVAQEICLERFILIGGAAALTGACNGSDGDLAALKADQNLRRGTHYLKLTQVDKVKIGGRVQIAQRAIQRQGRLREGDHHALRWDDLHHVSPQNIVPNNGYPLFKGFLRDRKLNL